MTKIKTLHYIIIILLFLFSEISVANFDDNNLICCHPDDSAGLTHQPLMYYFENGRVRSYVLNKKMTKKSILASQKQYLVEKNVDKKYKPSGRRFIFWHQGKLTYLYNKTTNTLKIRRLDQDKDIYACTVYSSKKDFLMQVKKWGKLHNLREEITP